MALGGNDQEILNEIIKQQKIDNKRIERLETLEFHKARLGMGCIEWLDYDIQGAVASMRVDVPAPVGVTYGWTHLTVFYALTGSAGNTIRMTINNIALANYAYNYSYTRGSGVGITTSVGAEGQTSMVVGRFPSSAYVVGWYHIPFFPVPIYVHTYGEWVTYNSQLEAGSVVEKGEFGGVYLPDGQRVNRIDIFASAGNIGDYVYLYGWCPTWTIGQGPPD